MHEDDKEILSLEEDGFLMYYRTFLPLPLPALTNKKHKLRVLSDQAFYFLMMLFLITSISDYKFCMINREQAYDSYYIYGFNLERLQPSSQFSYRIRKDMENTIAMFGNLSSSTVPAMCPIFDTEVILLIKMSEFTGSMGLVS